MNWFFCWTAFFYFWVGNKLKLFLGCVRLRNYIGRTVSTKTKKNVTQNENGTKIQTVHRIRVMYEYRVAFIHNRNKRWWLENGELIETSIT